MIEGKLQDMGHEPCNVQVIVQGEGEHAVLYLLDDNGTIDDFGVKPRVT